jgi:putative ABC transport system permease protein
MSRRLFDLLLHAYPRSFRERFGPEMRALFEERSAATAPGLIPRARFWIVTAADMLPAAARERFSGRITLRDSLYDLRQAWRAVARAPWLAAFVVLLMALTIGSTTAAFSVVNATLLRPLPFADPDRLVALWERRGPDVLRNGVGGHEYPEWKGRSRSFAGMAAFAFDREYNLTGAGEPLRLTAVRVTADFFPVMGVAPLAGRWFTADEDRPGGGAVVVIAESLWRARFGADPSLVGRTVQLNGIPHAVVGVMPARFAFPQGAGGSTPDAWTPIAEPIQLYRGRHYLFVVARLQPGITVAHAQREMDGVAAQIERELPQFSRGHGVNVLPLHSETVQTFKGSVLLVFAGVGLVLAIGVCNVANLLLTRAAGRRQEISVRIALGASRFRVARQLLAEGGVLAAAGGTAGVVLAVWLIDIARAAAPADVPRLRDAAVDPAAALVAAGVTIVTALIFGLVPLAHVLRVDVGDSLKHGSKGVVRATRQPLRRALVVAEVALTVIVACGASLFLQSLTRLLRVDPGFETGNIFAVELALPAQRYRGAPEQRAFVDDALARVRTLPGVTSAAATNIVPHGGSFSGVAVAIEGQPAPPPGEERSAAYRVVSAGYFTTLGMPMLSGRGFGPQDARAAVPLIRWFPRQPLPPRFNEPQAMPVAVINESMGRQFWPGMDPVGRRFTVLFSPPITVVGVVRDSRNRALAHAASPEFYLSDAQEPQANLTLLVRGGDGDGSLPAGIRSRIRAIDPDLPIATFRTLAEIVDGNLTLYRALTSLLGAFAALALVLMALGLHAVVSYAAAQRTFEIGVRLALGAQRSDIRRLVVGSGIGLAASGLVAGIAVAYPVARLASGMLYDIEPGDPLTYAGLAGVILTVAVLATWLPARRAQRVDPVKVLRAE